MRCAIMPILWVSDDNESTKYTRMIDAEIE